MDIFKILVVGITGALFAVMLGSYKKELAMAVSIVTGLVIISMLLSQMRAVFAEFAVLIEETGINPEYFVIVLKVTGIAYAAQFAGELCRDAGEGAIALKIETAAKVTVMVLTVPILRDFLKNIVSILV